MTYILITYKFSLNNYVQTYSKFNINTIDIKNDLLTFKSNFNPANYLKPSRRFPLASSTFKLIKYHQIHYYPNYDQIWKKNHFRHS